MATKLTAERRDNLEKLATYLERLPADYRHFAMGDYLTLADADLAAAAKYAEFNGGVDQCGTAACAVGHGPAAGILMPPGLAKDYASGAKMPCRVWTEYASLFIGADGYSGYEPDVDLFEWLFSADWTEIDNSHYGAAARIRYLLARGSPPEDFDTPEDADPDLYAAYRVDVGELA